MTPEQQADSARIEAAHAEQIEKNKNAGKDAKQLANRMKGVEYVSKRKRESAMIPGYINRRGLFPLFGAPYVGKTFYAVDLACTIAAGLPEWLDIPTALRRPGDVVYAALEGGQPFWDALEAWIVTHPEADLSGFHVLDGDEGHNVHVDTSTGRKRDEMGVRYEDSFDRLLAEIDELGLKPRMIVFDTQIDLAPGINENDAGEVSALYSTLSREAKVRNCVIVLVHHLNKNGDYRGSSVMFGKADMSAKVTKDDSEETRTVEFLKVKGARKPENDLAFHLADVLIEHGSGQSAVIVPGVRPDSGQTIKERALILNTLDTWGTIYQVRKALGDGTKLANHNRAVKLVSDLVAEEALEKMVLEDGRERYRAIPLPGLTKVRP